MSLNTHASPWVFFHPDTSYYFTKFNYCSWYPQKKELSWRARSAIGLYSYDAGFRINSNNSSQFHRPCSGPRPEWQFFLNQITFVIAAIVILNLFQNRHDNFSWIKLCLSFRRLSFWTCFRTAMTIFLVFNYLEKYKILLLRLIIPPKKELSLRRLSFWTCFRTAMTIFLEFNCLEK